MLFVCVLDLLRVRHGFRGRGGQIQRSGMIPSGDPTMRASPCGLYKCYRRRWSRLIRVSDRQIKLWLNMYLRCSLCGGGSCTLRWSHRGYRCGLAYNDIDHAVYLYSRNYAQPCITCRIILKPKRVCIYILRADQGWSSPQIDCRCKHLLGSTHISVSKCVDENGTFRTVENPYCDYGKYTTNTPRIALCRYSTYHYCYSSSLSSPIPSAIPSAISFSATLTFPGPSPVFQYRRQ